MTKARDIASATTPNANAALLATFPHRNLIINGAMQVAQRGDSTGVSTSNFYASDRFKAGLVSIGTWNVENSSDAPAGFSNSQKFTCTTPTGTLSASDNANINYKIEAQDLQQLDYGSSGAKSFTISFYVKSNKTGNASLEISQTDPSSIRSVVLQYNISSANTWEYKKLTVAGDTAGQINNDNGESMQMVWWLRTGTDLTGGSHQTAWYTRVDADRNVSNLDVGATANDYFQITGVKLEVSETATPFEHRSYGDELRRCQRYFYRPFVTSGGDEDAELGWPRFYTSVYGSGGIVHIEYPVTMRTNPILTYTTGAGVIDSDLSSYVKAQLRDTNDVSHYIYNFQASAEL